MNDILEYMTLDPLYRSGFHRALTFSLTYCFSENFVLPLSHDEVVHGKKSLLDKMPGNYDEKFANLRLLYAYMYAHPGKKLLFMGAEFAQFIEWNEWQALDWHLMGYESHKKMHHFLSAWNEIYVNEPCLYELDTTYDGYEWIEVDNANESIISFERLDKKGNRLICIINFTPVWRHAHPIGVSALGDYDILLHTSTEAFGGHCKTHFDTYTATKEAAFNRPYRITVPVPPLTAMYIKRKEE